MLKFIKKGVMLPIVMLACCIPLSANAGSVTSDDYVHQYDKDSKYYVQAYFNPSHKVQRGEGFGLKVNKNVKQAYVRAQSDGKTVLGVKICGSYDSGRQWSSAARNKSSRIISTPLESVKDCWTCKQRTYYGWVYF